MALSFVYVAFSLTALPNYSAMKALSVVFPPFTYINIIGDIAVSESQKIPWSLNTPATRSYRTPGPSISAYMYLIFFILQIIGYTAGTFLLERYLWGIRRVYDRIDATSDVALRLTNVSKTFSGSRRWYWPFVSGRPVPAVQSLNLELKKGSVSFLLGPNGGGKTTALRCIAGMTNMDNDSRLEINEAGTAFGICPQQNALFEDLTVAEHVRIWRLIKSAAINEAEIKEQEEDVLQECDLLEKRNAVVKTLSGGQKRKLQLALAFVGGSKMCCVDEATSGLDPLSRRNIWNIIYQANSRGRTVLMTTHFLDEVRFPRGF